jgi:hypothetical protein
MWKLLKFFGHLLRLLFLIAALLTIIATALLYIAEHGIPTTIVKRFEEKISDEDVIIQIGRATFTFDSGLQLYDITAEPRKLAGEKFGTIEKIKIALKLSPFIPHNQRIKSIHLSGVEMPRHPRRIFRKLAKMRGETPPHKQRRKLPPLTPFKLFIDDSCLIGLNVTAAEATVVLNEPVICFNSALIKWQGNTPHRQITGRTEVDLKRNVISGTASGLAFQEDLEPFLHEMGARGAIREMARITAVEKAARANCSFAANIENGDFMIDIDIDVDRCCYRNIPLDYARFNLTACETNGTMTVEINNLTSASTTGKLEGDIFYDEADESVRVQGTSTMDHKDVLTMINILTHGELNPLQPQNPPIVTVKGVAAVSTNSVVKHNLDGNVRIGTGVVFGLIVQEANAKFKVIGDHAYLKDVVGHTPTGGSLSGDAKFDINNTPELPPTINANVEFNAIDLIDLAKIFSITNARIGECAGKLRLSGLLGTNQLHTINGAGSFDVKKGLLTRLPLFAGFTDYISRNIPGVDRVVDQSDCSLDFTIRNGILSSDNFLIEGDVFSIQGKGDYDIVSDDLDFTVHVALFRQKTFAGRIIRMVTFPFKKLLLEFKVYGSVEKPEWSYVNILEKITDQVPEKK